MLKQSVASEVPLSYLEVQIIGDPNSVMMIVIAKAAGICCVESGKRMHLLIFFLLRKEYIVHSTQIALFHPRTNKCYIT